MNRCSELNITSISAAFVIAAKVSRSFFLHHNLTLLLLEVHRQLSQSYILGWWSILQLLNRFCQSQVRQFLEKRSCSMLVPNSKKKLVSNAYQRRSPIVVVSTIPLGIDEDHIRIPAHPLGWRCDEYRTCSALATSPHPGLLIALNK